MNKEGTELLQHWMKDVITCQGTMQYKLQRAGYLHSINEQDVVAETRGISIYSRINVYTSGYVMRLQECICADFPMLQKFMGDEAFNAFAKAALMWSPSTSYSLYDLGNTFIRFLEATRPKGQGEPNENDIYLELPVEIAKTERARQEVLRARGEENNVENDAELFAGDILFNTYALSVQTPECLRLLELKFPVKRLFEQLNNDEDYDIPEPALTYLAISRLNYRPDMEELEPWQYFFLKACSQARLLQDAVQETALAMSLPSATLVADLCIWLPIFKEKGFIIIR